MAFGVIATVAQKYASQSKIAGSGRSLRPHGMHY